MKPIKHEFRSLLANFHKNKYERSLKENKKRKLTLRRLRKSVFLYEDKVIIEGVDLSEVSVAIREHIGKDLFTWNVNGNNLQHNIGGDNIQNDIGGNNSQRCIDGDNSQGNIGGNNSQWDIFGNNDQWAVHGSSLNSKHCVDEERGIKTVDMDWTDGLCMYSVKTRNIRGGIKYITGFDVYSGAEIYLVKTQNISYHSNISLADAKRGFKAKRDKLFNELGRWVMTLTDESILTRELFHEETGSCMPGIEVWCEKVGIDKNTKEITFKEFKELAAQYPTMETQKIMAVLESLKLKKAGK